VNRLQTIDERHYADSIVSGSQRSSNIYPVYANPAGFGARQRSVERHILRNAFSRQIFRFANLF